MTPTTKTRRTLRALGVWPPEDDIGALQRRAVEEIAEEWGRLGGPYVGPDDLRVAVLSYLTIKSFRERYGVHPEILKDYD